MRRLVILPVTFILAVVGAVCSPFIMLGAALVDRFGHRPHWPRLRIAILVIAALIIEVIGVATSFVVWVLTGFGVLGTQRWRWHMHRRFMGWYTTTMLGLIVRVLGSSIDWRDSDDLSPGPVILIARHTSFFDALIPAAILSGRNPLLAHHVVTQGLRYAPCIDIVGHRFPNRFITRSPGEGSRELGPIAQIGAVLDDRSAAIIFPEGTFRNPERFERVVRRLRRRQPERAARAEQLDHVLPPRSNGTLALLEGAPSADLVICVNTGFEPFGSIKAILDHPFADRPIVIETWRIPRSQVPHEPDAFDQWLFERFVEIDGWVTRVGAE